MSIFYSASKIISNIVVPSDAHFFALRRFLSIASNKWDTFPLSTMVLYNYII